VFPLVDVDFEASFHAGLDEAGVVLNRAREEAKKGRDPKRRFAAGSAEERASTLMSTAHQAMLAWREALATPNRDTLNELATFAVMLAHARTELAKKVARAPGSDAQLSPLRRANAEKVRKAKERWAKHLEAAVALIRKADFAIALTDCAKAVVPDDDANFAKRLKAEGIFRLVAQEERGGRRRYEPDRELIDSSYP